MIIGKCLSSPYFHSCPTAAGTNKKLIKLRERFNRIPIRCKSVFAFATYPPSSHADHFFGWRGRDRADLYQFARGPDAVAISKTTAAASVAKQTVEKFKRRSEHDNYVKIPFANSSNGFKIGPCHPPRFDSIFSLFLSFPTLRRPHRFILIQSSNSTNCSSLV